jgi:hypothetical protein
LGCSIWVDERVERLAERLRVRGRCDIERLRDGRRWERRGDPSRKRTGISRLFGQVVVIIRGPVGGCSIVPGRIVSYNPVWSRGKVSYLLPINGGTVDGSPLCSDQLGGSGGFMFITWGGGGGGTGPGPGTPPFDVDWDDVGSIERESGESEMLYDLMYYSADLSLDSSYQGIVMGSESGIDNEEDLKKKNMSNIATSSVRVFSVILALSSQKSTKSKGGHGDIDGWQHQSATAIGSL